METNIEKTFTLESGVRGVVSIVPSQVSYVCLYINAGSRDETQKVRGCMHMIEHLLFKGTKLRTYFDIMNYIESVGGDMNAYTSKEETCIYITIQNQYVQRAFDVLSDIFYNSIFLYDEFCKEREVVIDEINSYKDSPAELIFDDFEEYFFKSHKISANILGEISDLKKMSIDDVTKEYATHYISSNAMISYVGSLESDFIIDLSTQYFSVRKDSLISYEREKVTSVSIFDKTVKKKTFQTHCMLGMQAPSMYADNKTAMVLLNNLLGGSSFNSLLNFSLREERGLTYNIESNYTSYSDTGLFTIYFGTDSSKLDLCKQVIFEVFDSLVAQGLADDKLELFKQQLIGQLAISFDGYVSLMISNAKSFMCYDKVDSFMEIKQKITDVTHEDIILLSKNMFDRNNISQLLYV